MGFWQNGPRLEYFDMLTTGGTLAIVGGRGIPHERSYEVVLGCPEGLCPSALLTIPHEWGIQGG